MHIASPSGMPVKVSLFDEDYVVVRRGSGQPPLAMTDRCPSSLIAAVAAALAAAAPVASLGSGRLSCRFRS